eukprot:296489_1
MSTGFKTNSKWNKSLSFPFTDFLQPSTINNDEFTIMVVTKKKGWWYNKKKGYGYTGDDGIYKFSTQKNEWTKIFDYDKNFRCSPYSVAYDNKHKLLYICDVRTWPSTMSTFDLKTRNKVTSKTEQDAFALIFVEDKLHKICNGDGDHYIYDKTKQFQKI